MKPAWMRELLRSPEAEGAAGGDGNPGEAPGQGGATASPSGDGGGDAGPDGSPPSRSSILDFAKRGEAGGEGEGWTPPDGLELPDHLRGADADDTLRKLATAYKGARQELSTRKKEDGVLEGAVPKDIDGYQITGDDPDDPIIKDLTSEESKPIVDAWRKAALEVGIPDAAFSKFMQQGIRNMAEQGLQISGDPAETMRVNGEAQLEQLYETHGKAGGDQMLRAIDTYAQKLAQNQVLRSQEDVQEFAQMVGTAHALELMHRIIVAEFGEKPIPRADGVEGAPSPEEAYELHRQALAMPPGQDREEAVERAEKQLRKALQESSTPGQVRSRVL